MNKNKYKFFNKNNTAFTLVELIIVITILAILATIAFISFQNYFGNARDSNRVSTIKNIETGLELFTLKTSTFPTPDEVKTYTGGLEGKSQLNQGIIGENVSRIISLSNIPLDPKEKTHYVYSTFGENNKYYQVGIDSENNELSFISQVYAKSKSSIVKGNYRFDPSLPSLIVVENEALTNSGIFSPEVCFVLDGGKNSLNECNEIKSEIKLKDYDNSLVGYWDMESLTDDGKLKDLSGNQNHGICYNGTSSGACGLVGPQFSGNTMYFNGIDKQYVEIQDNDILEIGNKGTIYIKFKIKEKSGLDFVVDYAKLLTKLDSGTGCVSAYTYNLHVAYLADESYVGVLPKNIGDVNQIICENTNNVLNIGTPNIFNVDYSMVDVIENGNYSFYTNGLIKFNNNNGNYFLKNTNENWHIGKGKIYYLNGFIDEVKIYNRALSPEEILQQSKIAGF